MTVAAIAAAVCVWANPGADPYRSVGMDKVDAALKRYGFPTHVQKELHRKIHRIDFDSVMTITRDGYTATGGEVKNLRDMHFGKDRLCKGAVSTSKWAPGRQEIAPIYCVNEHCVAVPIVCGNISRVDFYPELPKTKPIPEWAEPPRLKSPTPIPEPSTLLLAVAGVAGIIAGKRRK